MMAKDIGAKIHKGVNVRYIVVPVRIRQDREADLFAMLADRKRDLGAFLRSALTLAVRAGTLTPSGYTIRHDEHLEALQIQLQMERDRCRRLEAELADAEVRAAAAAEKQPPPVSLPADEPQGSKDAPIRRPSKFLKAVTGMQD